MYICSLTKLFITLLLGLHLTLSTSDTYAAYYKCEVEILLFLFRARVRCDTLKYAHVESYWPLHLKCTN